MKKYVLSAVVTGLLVTNAVYAMDDGPAPAVEVEVPAVEISPPENIEIDPGNVGIEPSVDIDANVYPTPQIAICPLGPDFELPVDESGEKPEMCVMPGFEEIPVDENGNSQIYYTFGGVVGGSDGSPGEEQNLEVPKGQEIDHSEVFVTALNQDVDSTTRPIEGIQPNFRGSISDRGAESLAASAGHNDNGSPAPQFLNDEQRGAVRGLRSDGEQTKPRAGFTKLFSKLSKPKSEITQASATSPSKSLSSQLAEVDRMRDTAVRTGDQKLLAKADKLEKRLRADSGKSSKTTTRSR